MASSLGGHYSADGLSVAFAACAPNATRLAVWLYAAPTAHPPVLCQAMAAVAEGVYTATIPLALLGLAPRQPIYYGYRAWGPNWPWDQAWQPGTVAGFATDADGDGNRFNPNKLLLDPYALEVSHCVQTPDHPDRTGYLSGAANRLTDTGPFAPKGLVLPPPTGGFGVKPTRPFKDDTIYEVHLRGLTQADPAIPAALRGTYAGAALKAPYLAALGITAVEFLPIHQTQNALNDDPTLRAQANYWGYDTMSYLAPDRRYAADKSPGGPTREWIAMAKAFHDAGLKVFVDVVYNHHEESGVDVATGTIGTIYSLRGLDNATYYETDGAPGGPQRYRDDNGVGPNLNVATEPVRDLVLASLTYWADVLGADGFRFDLAAVLGNEDPEHGYAFSADDPDNILNRAVRALPARPAGGGAGVDLIAEPYTDMLAGQEQGNFPIGWAEWNDRFRDTIRAAQNKLGILPITPGQFATRIAGSADLFQPSRRPPAASVNYIVSHDGFTLADLHSFGATQNDQPLPRGPSDGGRSADAEMCWDHGGDPVQQQQAIRTSLALLLLSAGVPMLTGGSEMGRTQFGNSNAYNLDNVANWLDWSAATRNPDLLVFARRLLQFRLAHQALRPAAFFTGMELAGSGVKDLTWLKNDASEIDPGYFADASQHFIAWQLDGALAADPATRLYIAYNGWVDPVQATLPALPGAAMWRLVMATGQSGLPWGNIVAAGAEKPLAGPIAVDGRSCILAIA